MAFFIEVEAECVQVRPCGTGKGLQAGPMSTRRKSILVTVGLIGIFAGLVFVIFFMDRSTDISDADRVDLKALRDRRVPILLEFGKGWCQPCKYMKPILDEVARAYEGKAVVRAVDMDANVDLVRRFSIRVMPTQVFLSPDGREFFRNEGVLEREHIVQILSRMGAVTPQPHGGS